VKQKGEFLIAVAVVVMVGCIVAAAFQFDHKPQGRVACNDGNGGVQHSSVQAGWKVMRNGTYMDRDAHVFRPKQGMECAVEKDDT
jgi:hypothetical protein